MCKCFVPYGPAFWRIFLSVRNQVGLGKIALENDWSIWNKKVLTNKILSYTPICAQVEHLIFLNFFVLYGLTFLEDHLSLNDLF